MNSASNAIRTGIRRARRTRRMDMALRIISDDRGYDLSGNREASHLVTRMEVPGPGSLHLYGLEPPPVTRRDLDPDRIATAHFAAGHHDRHHAGLADHASVLGLRQRRRHEARGDGVELMAGTAEPGDLEDRFAAE